MKTEVRIQKVERASRVRRCLRGSRRPFGLWLSVFCLLFSVLCASASTLRTPSWWRYRQRVVQLICTNCLVAQPSAIITNSTGPSACNSLVYSWRGCNVFEEPDWVWTNSFEILQVTPGSGPGLYDIYSDCNQDGIAASDASLTCDTNGFLCGSALLSDGLGNTNMIVFSGCP